MNATRTGSWVGKVWRCHSGQGCTHEQHPFEERHIMNLDTIEMPVEQAKADLADYRAILKQERRDRNRAEDLEIAAGLRAIAAGRPLLRLSETCARGGYFDNGMPRIAVVRADATRCWAWRDSWNGLSFVFAD